MKRVLAPRKEVIPDRFEDEEGKHYHFKASGGLQTVSLCCETDKNVLFELDFKNAYKMLDFLEKAIDYIETSDE